MPIICSKCKINRPVLMFKKNGRTLKSCQVCREGMPTKRPVVDDENNEEEEEGVESVESVESCSDETSVESESESESESDYSSSEPETIVCEACNKEFYDEESAYKHSQTVSHKKKWSIFQDNQ